MSRELRAIVRYLCRKSDWAITNLQIQKILYILYMCYYGIHKKKLIQEPFEAWAYGPVIPALYHDFKMFGADPIEEWYLSDTANHHNFNQDQVSFINKYADQLLDVPTYHLVQATHAPGGAWNAVYDESKPHTKLVDKDILAEFTNHYANNGGK